jgi:hypothetical protein
MNTRILESKRFYRNSVAGIETLNLESNSLHFKTFAKTWRLNRAEFSGSAGILPDAPHTEVEGRLRLDLINKHVIRVRCA